MTLKGGLALELRIEHARTTRDIDLRMNGGPEDAFERLRAATRLDLGDFMSFEIERDRHRSEIEAEGMQHVGQRYRAECRIAGKIYGRRFGVDVALAEPMSGEPDLVVANDVLRFAGVDPPRLRVYPVAVHIAEKLHALSLPRSRPNSRVKDLPDIALLASIGRLDGGDLRGALERTFAHRGTHALPKIVERSPAFWREPYARIAVEDDLPWSSLDEFDVAVAAFLGPVLVSAGCGTWQPERWAWTR